MANGLARNERLAYQDIGRSMTQIDLIQSDLKGRGRREEGGRDREERFLTGEEKEEEEVVTRGDCGGKQR